MAEDWPSSTAWSINSPQVDQVAAITDLNTAEAREIYAKALNSHNGDAERVINEYFTAGGDFTAFASKYTYDATAWAAGRDGVAPGLTIQGPDEHPPTSWEHINGNHLSAPSRPPSRNRSPLGTVTDWQIDTALGIEAPTNMADEEANIQRALAASLETSTPQEPQQSGIQPSSEPMQRQVPVFGPTNRNDHNVDEWALMRAPPAPVDALPSARKRVHTEPVFLRCRDESGMHMHSVGPYLMLLHSISATRNMLLFLREDAESGAYGDNPGWWRGEPIHTALGQISLVDELKRLMAFLDITERSYGTADVLNTKLEVTSGQFEPITRMLEVLFNYIPREDRTRLWTSTKTVDEELGGNPQEYSILKFPIKEGTLEPMRNLYSQWDEVFWNNSAYNSMPGQENKPPALVVIEEPAKVMTFRVTSADGPVDVPEVLYIDRYLEENVEIARDMRDQMSLMRRVIEKSNAAIDRLTRVTTKTGLTADSRLVYQRLIARSEGLISQIRTRALWKRHEQQTANNEQPLSYLPAELNHLLDDVQLDEADQAEVKQLEAEVQQTQARLSRLEGKISNITKERDLCAANLKRINATFTVPSEDERLNPAHRYTLRGVITSMNVVYMCQRADTEPYEEVDNDANLNSWLMISWDGNEKQVKHEHVTFAKVKEAMFTEVDSNGETAPYVVYASKEALNEVPVTISSELQTFIKHDNRLFKQELIEQPEQREKKRVGFRSPQSPAKRQRSCSGDSMDSNRASLGDMSDGDRAQIMADQMMDSFGGSNDSGIDTEMMDMQPITDIQMANEIAAHMPPTPSLSADGSVSPPIRRSTEQLANMSLDKRNGDDKAPEMEELQAPFLVRRPASGQGGVVDQSATESLMTWPDIDETTAITGANNPEEFYHPPT